LEYLEATANTNGNLQISPLRREMSTARTSSGKKQQQRQKATATAKSKMRGFFAALRMTTS
jgi:hypothetical protein